MTKLTEQIEIIDSFHVRMDRHNIVIKNGSIFVDDNLYETPDMVAAKTEDQKECIAMLELSKLIVLYDHYSFKGTPIRLMDFKKVLDCCSRDLDDSFSLDDDALGKSSLKKCYEEAMVAVVFCNFYNNLPNSFFGHVLDIERDELKYTDKRDLLDGMNNSLPEKMLHYLQSFENPTDFIKHIGGTDVNEEEAQEFISFLEDLEKIDKATKEDEISKENLYAGYERLLKKQGVPEDRMGELKEANSKLFSLKIPNDTKCEMPREILLDCRKKNLEANLNTVSQFEIANLYVTNFVHDEYERTKDAYIDVLPNIFENTKETIFMMYQTYYEGNLANRIFDTLHGTTAMNLRNSQVRYLSNIENEAIRKHLQLCYNKYCKTMNCLPLLRFYSIPTNIDRIHLGFRNEKQIRFILSFLDFKYLDKEDRKRFIVLNFPDNNDEFENDFTIDWKGFKGDLVGFLKAICPSNISDWDLIAKRFTIKGKTINPKIEHFNTSPRFDFLRKKISLSDEDINNISNWGEFV